MTTPELEVVWDGGSFDLLGWNETDQGEVLCEALGEGTDWGNAETTRQVLRRALLAGEALDEEEVGNQSVTLRLRLKAPDGRALSAAEKILHLLRRQRGVELRWTAPDAYAVPVAFIAAAVKLERVYADGWDLAERRAERIFTLTLTCLPFARSIAPVTIEALPPFVAAPSTLDDCSSAAGWTVDDPNTTLSVSGGVEVLVDHDQPPGPALFVTHPGGFTMTERYLAIEQTGFEQVNFAYVSINGGATLPLVGAEGGWRFHDADAYTGTPVTSLVFGFLGLKSGYPSWPDFTIATIAESATPAASTGRQSLRVLQVGGSAPVDGSIAIEARTTPVATLPSEAGRRSADGARRAELARRARNCSRMRHTAAARADQHHRGARTNDGRTDPCPHAPASVAHFGHGRVGSLGRRSLDCCWAGARRQSVADTARRGPGSADRNWSGPASRL